MKTSCSSVLLKAAGANDIPAMLDTAADAGYGGIMLECRHDGGFDAGAFSFRDAGGLVRHAVAREVEIQCISSNCLRGCDDERDGEELRRDVCIAHALACPLVAFQAPPHSGAGAFEKRYTAILAIVREALECARELDICLAIEPAANTLVTTMDEAIDLVDDVELPNLGVVYPPGQLAHAHAEPAFKAVEMAGDFLLMARLDALGMCDLNDGVFDAALKELRAARFAEYVCDCGAPGHASHSIALAELRARAAMLDPSPGEAVDIRD